MKQLFIGSHPNTVKFSTLDGRDRVCEIRVTIAAAYTILRDEIGEKAKDESSVFHGPWLVFRNLMNEHPAACLEEYRHMAVYFDADTEDMITEICDLIEQHNELTRQSLSLKGLRQHQADAMIGISSTAGNMEMTAVQGLGKTRGSVSDGHKHRVLADKVKAYMGMVHDKQRLFEFCTVLTKRFGPSTFEDYSDSTENEMRQATWAALVSTEESLDAVRVAVHNTIHTLELPETEAFKEWLPGKSDDNDDQAAGDENYALRG